MKVLITTDLYVTGTNGVVASVRNLMEELEKKGHEVRVLTVSEKLRSHKEGNIYYTNPFPWELFTRMYGCPYPTGTVICGNLSSGNRM